MMADPTSLHPVRWSIAFLIALPFALLAIALLLSLARQGETAHSVMAALRYTLLAEAACLLILTAWGFGYERISAARDLRLHPPPGRLIDIGGYRLHLNCRGDGSPTVILEHGASGSYLDWYRVQPEIAAFTKVCSYDRAGYGWSDPSPKPRVPSAMAEELHLLLENAGLTPPFVLVGHSMGAFDALMYAHLHPQQVSALVLVDGSHPDESAPFSWREKIWLRFMQFTTPLGLPRWRKWCAAGPEEMAALKTAVNCKARVFAAEFEQRSALRAAGEEIRQLPALGSIPLVVISRDSKREKEETSPAEARWIELQKELLHLSSNATQVVAEGSGHAVPVHRPDVVIDSVRRIVQQAHGASGPQGPRTR
jgi:pimeloyl-ACP methyl ester carboxylesterase